MLFAYLFQQNVFPDRGTVYDFYFVKQASGSWNNWIERVDKAKNVIPKDAKVNTGYPVNNSNGHSCYLRNSFPFTITLEPVTFFSF